LISGTSNTVTQTVQPSDFSQNVQVNPTTDLVYVGTAILNGETLTEVAQNYTGTLQAIDPAHNLLFTIKSKMLYVLNGTTHSVIDSLQMDSWSYNFAAVNPNTSKLYLGNSYDNEIAVVSFSSPP
jgi:DNA-binding beta-propeller fold protein YncE